MNTEQINEAVKILKRGAVAAVPTDTTYGLAADATSADAVAKIYSIKGRSQTKLLSWFFKDLEQAAQYASLSKTQREILKKYLPGPYTFIVPSKEVSVTIGVRIIDHPVVKAVLAKFDKPITATSANQSGAPPAMSPSQLKNLSIDYILDAGTLPKSQPSTVVDLTKSAGIIIRQGKGKFPVS